MKTIAVFTSGGDSPGMNACIRAVVRTATSLGITTIGIERGYEGMINNETRKLQPRDVGNIIQTGGTILKTARSKQFMTPEGREKAYQTLVQHEIEGVIAIGGDGTFRGANVFAQTYNIPFIGIPGTIDNDMAGTDFTIGFDTATNTVVQAIDKIRDTASSHERLFFVEVMGRDAGYIALWSGLAGGAEAIFIPETHSNIQLLAEDLKKSHKKFSIVVVAEGDDAGNAFEVAEKVKQHLPADYDIRVTVLGHIQRGGNPTCADRLLATRLGVAAVQALQSNEKNVMVGIVKNEIVYTPLLQAVKTHLSIDRNLIEIAKMLSV